MRARLIPLDAGQSIELVKDLQAARITFLAFQIQFRFEQWGNSRTIGGQDCFHHEICQFRINIVERADGTATFTSAGRPIAIISNVMIEYHAPTRPASRAPAKVPAGKTPAPKSAPGR